MLKIKQKRHISLPHLTLPKPMQFVPVVDDGDELTEAINSDPTVHDDQWRLQERPDTSELEQYWDAVETDVKNDPKWFTFSSDEDPA